MEVYRACFYRVNRSAILWQPFFAIRFCGFDADVYWDCQFGAISIVEKLV
jgi:hypothetical protein